MAQRAPAPGARGASPWATRGGGELVGKVMAEKKVAINEMFSSVVHLCLFHNFYCNIVYFYIQYQQSIKTEREREREIEKER